MSTELDIAVLFARDPLSLSDQDIDRIIEHTRARRKTFDPEKIVKPKVPTKTEKKIEGLSLESLGISL